MLVAQSRFSLGITNFLLIVFTILAVMTSLIFVNDYRLLVIAFVGGIVCILGILNLEFALILTLSYIPLNGLLKRFVANPDYVAIVNPNHVAIVSDILITTCLISTLRMMKNDKRAGIFLYSPAMIPLGAFIFVCFVQIFNPNIVSTTVGIFGFRKTAYYMLMYFVGFYYFKSKEQVFRFINVMIVICAIIMFYGLYQFIRGPTTEEISLARNLYTTTTIGVYNSLRTTSTFLAPQALAMYLFVLLPFIFNKIIVESSKTQKILSGVLFIATSIVLLTTYYRAAYLGVILSISFYFLLLSRKQSRIKFRAFVYIIFILLLLVLVALSLVQFTNNPMIIGRVLSLVGLGQGYGLIEGQGDLSSLIARYYLWRQYLTESLRHPLGMGIGMSGNVLHRFTGENLLPHNTYVSITLELGIVGILIYLWLVITFFTKGLQSIRRIEDDFLLSLGITILSLLLGLIIISLSLSINELPLLILLVWFFMGMLFKLPFIEKQPLHDLNSYTKSGGEVPQKA